MLNTTLYFSGYFLLGLAYCSNISHVTLNIGAILPQCCFDIFAIFANVPWEILGIFIIILFADFSFDFEILQQYSPGLNDIIEKDQMLSVYVLKSIFKTKLIYFT